MVFPLAEMQMGGQYAWITTLSNQLRVYSINPIHGTLFHVPEYGIFQLNEKYRYQLGKAEIYLYNNKAANPIDILALDNVRDFLEMKSKQTLNMQDLGALVTKIKRGETRLNEKAKIISSMKKNVDENYIKLFEQMNEGLITGLAEELTDAELRIKPIDVGKKVAGYETLKDETIQWLNDFFYEDVVAQNYVRQMINSKDKYKIPVSHQLHGWLPQGASGKRNIVLAIEQVGLNKYGLKPDTKVKAEHDLEKEIIKVTSKKFGYFEVRESKTRYRYGRQNVYFVSVKATKPPAPAKIEKPLSPQQGKNP